ncbi:MAG: hypothetical protein HKN90_06215 [Flavobacteriaceae bacterium]|nr:hypothetical protein [Flavobacteriaceae bacterium]
METGKTRKYLKYAIGETLLIFIGVLIAISASQWYAKKKEIAYETKTLKEIYKGLQRDHASLDSVVHHTAKGIQSITILDSLFKHEMPPYSKSMDTLFGAVYGFRFFSLERANYEDLKANSLNLVRNDSIRQQLIMVFESEYSRNERIYTNELWVNEILRPFYLENFQNLIFYTSATPIHYKSICENIYYKNLVSYRLTFLKMVQKSYFLRMKHEIEKLMRFIERYIDT